MLATRKLPSDLVCRLDSVVIRMACINNKAFRTSHSKHHIGLLMSIGKTQNRLVGFCAVCTCLENEMPHIMLYCIGLLAVIPPAGIYSL